MHFSLPLFYYLIFLKIVDLRYFDNMFYLIINYYTTFYLPINVTIQTSQILEKIIMIFIIKLKFNTCIIGA